MSERMSFDEAKAWLLAHPGERLRDNEGDDWWADAAGNMWYTFGALYGDRPLVASRGYYSATFERPAAPKPRVTRIDVSECWGRGGWTVAYSVSGLSVSGPSLICHFFEKRPTVAEIKWLGEVHLGRELDFSEAYMIITEREKPRFTIEVSGASELARAAGYVRGYLDRAVESLKTTARSETSRPRVTRIDVQQAADSKWFAEFRASDGKLVRLRFGATRPSVDDVRDRATYELRGVRVLDFSGAYLIVEPYVAPKPRQRTWGLYAGHTRVGEVYDIDYAVSERRALSSLELGRRIHESLECAYTDQAFRRFNSAADVATTADFARAWGRP